MVWLAGGVWWWWSCQKELWARTLRRALQSRLTRHWGCLQWEELAFFRVLWVVISPQNPYPCFYISVWMGRVVSAEERSCVCCTLPERYQIIPLGNLLLLSNNRFFFFSLESVNSIRIFLSTPFFSIFCCWFISLLFWFFFPLKVLDLCRATDSGLSSRDNQEKNNFCPALYKLVMKCVCSWYLLIVLSRRRESNRVLLARFGRKLSLSFLRESETQWIHLEG